MNNILDSIKKHQQAQSYCRITRKVAENEEEYSRGYIIEHSTDFLILQQTNDFELAGFRILPVKQILKIRNNKGDKYYDKIMIWEQQKQQLGLKTQVNLSGWKTIFKTFQKKGKSIIVECEDPDLDTFTIGEVKRVTETSVYILYFDATGFLDEKPTRVDYENITSVSFDDRYVDVFSKYTRKRKAEEKPKKWKYLMSSPFYNNTTAHRHL